METRATRQMRTIESHFETRESEDNNLYIEGYFSVFDSNYDMAPGLSESVARGAFTNALKEDDVRALINHDTTFVLGRTKAKTLELREDEHGLFGRILINPNDTDAMNLYERVKRGDVDQCSFGFDITDEETENRSDGSVHWTIKAVKLYEVSVCTFPAYEATAVSARTAQLAEIEARKTDAWRENMRTRIKEMNNG